MTVLPGQRLSLQSHSNRAELWVVIDDGAVVQVGEDQHVWFVFLACSNAEGQSAVYIHGRGSKAGGKALPTNELS